MSLAAFLDEPEMNPHEAAWMARDWDRVDELTKEYTKEPEKALFGILNEINDGKASLRVSSMDCYDKFYIDAALSQHVDTLYSAFVMNLVGAGLDDQAHFDYHRLSIRKGKRYGAWAKLSEDNEEKVILAVLQKNYGVNTRIAMEYHQELKDLNIIDKWKRDNRNIALAVLGNVVKNKTDHKKVEKTIKQW